MVADSQHKRAGIVSNKDAGSVEPTAGGSVENSADTGKQADTGGWGGTAEPPVDAGGSTGPRPSECRGLAGASN